MCHLYHLLLGESNSVHIMIISIIATYQDLILRFKFCHLKLFLCVHRGMGSCLNYVSSFCPKLQGPSTKLDASP